MDIPCGVYVCSVNHLRLRIEERKEELVEDIKEEGKEYYCLEKFSKRKYVIKILISFIEWIKPFMFLMIGLMKEKVIFSKIKRPQKIFIINILLFGILDAI